jgi:hypothetical protein
MQGLLAGPGLSLQAKPSGRAAANEDFGQRSALNVVAGRAMNARLGRRKRKRLDVLDGNPLCCFCGERPAATEDHQRAKALFDRKEWPEGFVFPACEPCNKASKHYENVMSMLVRLAAAREDDPQRVADFLKYADAMRNNFPNLLRILSTREKRNHFQVEGISRPDGVAFADLRMVGIDDDLATTAVEAVLRKLLRAFYYKHTGTILLKNADVAVRCRTPISTPSLSLSSHRCSGCCHTSRRSGAGHATFPTSSPTDTASMMRRASRRT